MWLFLVVWNLLWGDVVVIEKSVLGSEINPADLKVGDIIYTGHWVPEPVIHRMAQYPRRLRWAEILHYQGG